MNVELPENLDTQPTVHMNNRYKYHNLNPREANVLPSVTESASVSFVLTPDRVINLGRYLLEGTITIADPAIANSMHLVDVSRPPLVSIRLESDGEIIYQNNYLSQYLKTVKALTMTRNEASKLDPVNTVNQVGWWRRVNIAAPFYPQIDNAVGAQAQSQLFDQLAQRVSVVAGGTADINFSIPLSDIVHSVFSVDVDMVLPKNCVLTIVFSAAQDFYVLFDPTKGNVAPYSATASYASDYDAAQFIPPTATYVITGLRLKEARQVDPVIIANVWRRVKSSSGLQVQIPILNVERPSVSATATSVSFDTTLYRNQHGDRVLRIYTTLFDQRDNFSKFHFMNSNNGYMQMSALRLSEDGEYLTNDMLTPDEYLNEMRWFYSDSILSKDRDLQLFNWCVVHNFTDMRAAELRQYERDIIGRPLDNNGLKCGIEFNKLARANHLYRFIVGQKTLTVFNNAAQNQNVMTLGRPTLAQ